MNMFLRHFHRKDLFLILLLVVVFSWIYGSAHAFGASSGDSPGYIINAARILKGQPLVYSTPFTELGAAYFGNPDEAAWLAPRHSNIVHADGTTVSRYPIGVSLLMAGAAILFGPTVGFYSLMWFSAMSVVVLTFCITKLVTAKLWKSPWPSIASLSSSVGLGLTSLMLEHAIGSPLRDLPALAFSLLALLLYLFAYNEHKRVRLSLILLGAAVALYGFSLNIRHTLVVLLPGFFLLLFAFSRAHFPEHQRVKRFLQLISISAAIVLFTLLPTGINSYRIYRATDVQSFSTESKAQTPAVPHLDSTEEPEQDSVQTLSSFTVPHTATALDDDVNVIVSNADHVKDLSLRNLFDNQGRFRQGEGSLLLYANVLWHVLPFLGTVPFALLGILFALRVRSTRVLSTGILLLGLGTVGLFSLWVNPYARYIIPALPFFFLFFGIGCVVFLRSAFQHARWIGILSLAIFLFTLAVTLRPAFQDAVSTPALLLENSRPIARTDLEAIALLPNHLPQAEKEVMLVTGQIKYGIPELLDAHADIPAIRVPDSGEIRDKDYHAILTRLLENGYTIYVWGDKVPRREVRELEKKYTLEPIHHFYTTFSSDVTIFHLTLPQS